MAVLNSCFPLGDGFGWAVAGTRITQELAKLADLRIFLPENTPQVDLGPLEAQVVQVAPSSIALAQGGPMLQAIKGPTFEPILPTVYSSCNNVGYFFIEDLKTAARYANASIYWDGLVAGSQWAKDEIGHILGRHDIRVAVQGVDIPETRSERILFFRDKFVIFSGGKFEYRKGQDIVIAAFKRFYEAHPDAHLVCAWANPWPESVRTMKESNLIAYDHEVFQGGYYASLVRNSIPTTAYTVVPQSAHHMMPAMYQQADVALFPNRCEAGTNLVMMECMASGVPVIAHYATGHKDVLGVPSAQLLISEGKEIAGHPGWREPDLDEIVSLMELAYQRRGEVLIKTGEDAREHMRSFTWNNTAQALLNAVCSSRHS